MLSNAAFIFVYAWSVHSLKGLFQPTKITAAMIATSTKSRRIVCESGRKGRVRAMEIVNSLKRVSAVGVTRFYRARLSNHSVIFVYVCDVQSLKGLFQPKAITAAMIKITTDSRRMLPEIARNAAWINGNRRLQLLACRVFRKVTLAV